MIRPPRDEPWNLFVWLETRPQWIRFVSHFIGGFIVGAGLIYYIDHIK